jgi:hypothetical protein
MCLRTTGTNRSTISLVAVAVAVVVDVAHHTRRRSRRSLFLLLFLSLSPPPLCIIYQVYIICTRVGTLLPQRCIGTCYFKNYLLFAAFSPSGDLDFFKKIQETKITIIIINCRRRRSNRVVYHYNIILLSLFATLLARYSSARRIEIDRSTCRYASARALQYTL